MSNIFLAAKDLILGDLWFNRSVNTDNALAMRACRVSANMQK